MLKKLGGAIVVAAVAFAGMAASAAVAVQMLRPEAKRPAAPEVAAAGATVAAKPQPKAKATKRAKAPAAPHPWNAPCAAAKSEAELLIATAELNQPDDILRLAREGVTINVRLYQTLRRTPAGGKAARTFLTRLERGIADDRKGVAQLERSITAEKLQRLVARSQKDNAALAAYAKRMGAPTCAEYFTG